MTDEKRKIGVVHLHGASSFAQHGEPAGLLGLKCSDVVLAVTPDVPRQLLGMPYGTVMTGASLVMPGPHLNGRVKEHSWMSVSSSGEADYPVWCCRSRLGCPRRSSVRAERRGTGSRLPGLPRGADGLRRAG